jgi:hypothetical protein
MSKIPVTKIAAQREVVKVTDLKPADYNPRSISEKALAGLKTSLDRFGYIQDIIWNRRTGNLVGGHQRFTALIQLYPDLEEVEVTVVDMDEADEKLANISLNNAAIQGDFTEDLGDLLEDVKEAFGDEEANMSMLDTLMVDDLAQFTNNLVEPPESFPEVGGSSDGEGETGKDAGGEDPSLTVYEVIVACDTPKHQREIFEKLNDMGMNCSVVKR